MKLSHKGKRVEINVIDSSNIEEAIRERLTQFGVDVKDSDTREILLEKERIFNEEREKVEYALISYYRTSLSLCFNINKKFLSKHLPLMRCIDKRIEESAIYIKWDDTPEDEFLLCIYLQLLIHMHLIYSIQLN